MSRVALVSFGGWPDTYGERLNALASHVDEIVIFRAADTREVALDETADTVTVVNLDSSRRLLCFPIYPLLFLAAFLKIHYLERRRFDAVHSLDYFVGPACVLLAGLISSARMVNSLRGFPQQFLDSYRERAIEQRRPVGVVLYYWLRLYYRIVLVLTDAVIVKSAHQRRLLGEIYGVKEKIHVIPTGVDFDSFSSALDPDLDDVESSLGVDPAAIERFRLLVLYAGRLIPEKGPQRLLEYHCGSESVDAGLVVVGNCLDEAFLATLTESARDCDRGTLISERLPHAAIPPLIAWCDVVAMLPTTRAEGCPKILQEALGMETPVIAADIEGIREELGDIDGCVLVDPADESAYQSALEQVTAPSSTVDVETVRERFDIERTYERVAAVYCD